MDYAFDIVLASHIKDMKPCCMVETRSVCLYPRTPRRKWLAPYFLPMTGKQLSASGDLTHRMSRNSRPNLPRTIYECQERHYILKIICLLVRWLNRYLLSHFNTHGGHTRGLCPCYPRMNAWCNFVKLIPKHSPDYTSSNLIALTRDPQRLGALLGVQTAINAH